MASHDEMARSFGTEAGAYERGRPEYPGEAVRWMLEPLLRGRSAVRIADVGAGTGKLTRAALEVLAETGGDVIAVEPDPVMLERLRASVPGVETLIGTAESMNLPDESLDGAVFGQSWHWVDPAAASREVARVVRPGGVLGLVWNVRDESVPWVAALTEVMRGSAAERFVQKHRAANGSSALVLEPFGALESQEWRWSRAMTRADLQDMVRSRSYVITAPPAERDRIERDVANLFDTVGAVGDRAVELPYVTTAFRVLRP